MGLHVKKVRAIQVPCESARTVRNLTRHGKFFSGSGVHCSHSGTIPHRRGKVRNCAVIEVPEGPPNKAWGGSPRTNRKLKSKPQRGDCRCRERTRTAVVRPRTHRGSQSRWSPAFRRDSNGEKSLHDRVLQPAVAVVSWQAVVVGVLGSTEVVEVQLQRAA